MLLKVARKAITTRTIFIPPAVDPEPPTNIRMISSIFRAAARHRNLPRRSGGRHNGSSLKGSAAYHIVIRQCAIQFNQIDREQSYTDKQNYRAR